MTYRLSAHAQARIKERRIPVEWLLSALEGRVARLPDQTLIFCDRASRCALVVNPEARVIITVYRMKRKQVKRVYSNKKGKWNERRMD